MNETNRDETNNQPPRVGDRVRAGASRGLLVEIQGKFAILRFPNGKREPVLYSDCVRDM